jgi:hypothetical protein
MPFARGQSALLHDTVTKIAAATRHRRTNSAQSPLLDDRPTDKLHSEKSAPAESPVATVEAPHRASVRLALKFHDA